MLILCFCFVALICLEEYEEAIKYLTETGGNKSLPTTEKGHIALLKEAKEGIIRNKKQEQQAWKGKFKLEENNPSKNTTATTSSPSIHPPQQSQSNFSFKYVILIVGVVFIGILIAFLYKSE